MVEQLVATPPEFERESDKRLFLTLRRRLWEYEPLRATSPRLSLHVSRGHVTISGRVRTLAQKEIIGYLCLRAEGVAQVENTVISDTEVVRQVADTLAADPDLAVHCIRVDVRDGVATLSGDVPDAGIEPRAADIARTAPAVEDVLSELTVRPSQRPPTVAPEGGAPALTNTAGEARAENDTGA